MIWLYLLFGSFTCNSAKQNRACPHVSVCTKPTVISVAWRVQDRIFSTEWPLVVTEWPLVDTPTFQPHKRGVAGALACHSGIEINTRTVQLEEPKRSRSHHARVGVTTLSRSHHAVTMASQRLQEDVELACPQINRSLKIYNYDTFIYITYFRHICHHASVRLFTGQIEN